MIDGDKTPSELLAPRYDLTDSELGILEQELVDVVKSSAEGSNNLSAVWLSPHSSYADIIRTQEAFYWPTMEEIMEPHEDRSLFLALVDTREGRDEVVHGFRISGGGVLDGQEPHETPTDESPASMTGIVLIDDIINSGQGLTTQEFQSYYESRGFDVSKFISVETNFNRPGMETRVERYNGLPATQVGYLALFQLCDKEDLAVNETAIFASLNQDAINSLELMGAEYEPLIGRDDLMTPVEDGKFDPDYRPVAIPATGKNLQLFREISVFAAPTVSL